MGAVAGRISVAAATLRLAALQRKIAGMSYAAMKDPLAAAPVLG